MLIKSICYFVLYCTVLFGTRITHAHYYFSNFVAILLSVILRKPDRLVRRCFIKNISKKLIVHNSTDYFHWVQGPRDQVEDILETSYWLFEGQ